MSLHNRLLLVFLAVVVAGCKPAVPAASVYQLTNVVESVENRATAPADVHFVGRNSCSATACHGQPQAESINWRNAHQAFEANDPHRRAFDVLYTARSVRMYRLLAEDEAKTIDDGVYLRFLEKNCVGCHATPPQGMPANGAFAPQPSPEVYWQGVSCESCHGPASRWLGTHYSLSWPENATARTHQAANGFQDTRNLDSRAAVCLNCHQGPRQLGEETYDVNHDLIAAGHPRLKFELHSYLANLPKHWSEAQELQRQQAADSQLAAAFHFNTWRAGQNQSAAREQQLREFRTKKSADGLSGWAEFANHDCRHCHHLTAEHTFRLTHNEPSARPDLFKNVSLTPTPAERAGVLLKHLDQSRKPQSTALLPSSDQGVDIYLAAAAFARDFPQEPPFTDLTRLQWLLAQQAGKTQYDLPTNFDPEQPELRQALNDLQQALERLAQPNRNGSRRP
ncbi:cytochrome c family protein [Anatilimnocola floriformis]|uniref:cytochrome c family protein n=1 Tax=Anatilimnocola floriformis TaxID=2948575 RepID=UPI0020C29C98|nr:cytochrome c family protein [Anatilimnocola floriformis]